jgi:hypothetical protein
MMFAALPVFPIIAVVRRTLYSVSCDVAQIKSKFCELSHLQQRQCFFNIFENQVKASNFNIGSHSMDNHFIAIQGNSVCAVGA